MEGFRSRYSAKSLSEHALFTVRNETKTSHMSRIRLTAGAGFECEEAPKTFGKVENRASWTKRGAGVV